MQWKTFPTVIPILIITDLSSYIDVPAANVEQEHTFATLKPELLLGGGRRAAFERQVQTQSGQTADAARRH